MNNCFFKFSKNLLPCYVGPCHHSMARPWIANGGDGLQIWRVTTNILNKQSREAEKGWSSSLGQIRDGSHCLHPLSFSVPHSLLGLGV
jgi:hypothetical protein